MPVVAGMSRQVQENLQGEGNKVFLRGLIFTLLGERSGKGKVRDERGVSMRKWCPLEAKMS